MDACEACTEKVAKAADDEAQAISKKEVWEA